MPKFSQSHGHSQKAGQTVGSGRKRKLDASVVRARQFSRDCMRGGTPSEIMRAFDQDAATSEAQSDDDLASESAEDLIDPDLSEISLADEDDFEGMEEFSRETLYTRHESEHSPTTTVPWDCVTIAVVGDHAVFHIPDWALGISDDDMDLRWNTYAKIAEWLTHKRQDFLRKPDFMALAGNAVSLAPPVSVLQEGLIKMLGLACDVSTFSKHAEHCIIVWPNRQLPLDALWSKEVKLAWCAQATIQRQKDRGYAAKSSDLGRSDIQPPKVAEEKALLRTEAIRGWQLGPRFAQLLCVLTDCKWSDVIERHGDAIFYKG